MPTRTDREAALVVIYGEELGRIYSLGAPSAVIGRSSKCEIRVDQESISRNHSKIVNTGKSVLIRDLGSSNGTYVNDEPIQEYVLRDGDLIKVGRTIFKFLSGGNIELLYHEKMFKLASLNRQPPATSANPDRSKTRTLTEAADEQSSSDPKKNENE